MKHRDSFNGFYSMWCPTCRDERGFHEDDNPAVCQVCNTRFDDYGRVIPEPTTLVPGLLQIGWIDQSHPNEKRIRCFRCECTGGGTYKEYYGVQVQFTVEDALKFEDKVEISCYVCKSPLILKLVQSDFRPKILTLYEVYQDEVLRAIL